jgi:dipeptidase E
MSGFADALVAFCKSGRTVYGGSAGAIVLGRDIASCASYDVDLRGMDNTRALDLCASSSVWCHFEARHEALLAEYIERSNETLIVLGKAAGALVTDDGVFGLGNGSAGIWSLERRALLPMTSLVG